MFDPKTRILIVDDMMTMRKVIAKICREIGFTEISEASDGAKGWQALTEAAPAIGIVISDWNMPNCSGLELLKRVRADHRFQGLPFLMVTAEAEKHQIVEALKSGVTGYVVKPFTAAALKQKLETAHAAASAPKKAA